MAELFPTLLLLERSGQKNVALSTNAMPTQNMPKRIDNFRIVRQIGRGGMGVVYEAWDETLDRTVAVKVLHDFQGNEQQAVRRFQREAQTAARLHHTNIVPVFGTGFFEGEFYYVMQAISGIGIDRFLEFFQMKQKDERTGTTTRRESPLLYAEIDSSATTVVSLPNGAPMTVGLASHAAEDQNQTEKIENDTEIPAEIQSLNADDQNLCRAILHQFVTGEYGDAVQYRLRPETKEKPRNVSGVERYSKDSFFDGSLSFSAYARSVCGVGIQVAQALDYAHRHDILHRDVKPSNLLLDRSATVWITDFGLARPTNDSNLTRSGQIIGTLRYMAPEALEGRFTPGSDIYSLGLTLYEMLAFEPAYKESNYTVLLGQIAEGYLIPPRRLNRLIPRDLETIILKATEKDPQHRYRTAAAMADDLRLFLEERPIHARRISLVGRFWRWCRRNRLVAASVILSAILLMALTAVMTVGFIEERSLRLDRELASAQATENLNGALAAFDDIFSTFGSSTRSWDFVGGTGDFFQPLPSLPVSETDRKVLDSLLVFYDRFSAENANNENLLTETARAYAHTGRIRQRVGHSDEAFEAYKKSIEYYRKSFAVSSDPAALELEEAQVVCRFLPLLLNSGETAFADILDLAIDALRRAYPNEPTDRELRARILAKLLGFRALTGMTASRCGRDRSLAAFLFFEEGEKPSFTSDEAEHVDVDLQQARSYLLDVAQSESSDAVLLAERNLIDGVEALWRAMTEEKEKSKLLQNRSIEQAEHLAADHPDSETLSFHKIEIDLLAVCAMRVDSDRADLADQRVLLESTLAAALTMHADYPDSPGYLAFVVIIRHALGRVALLTGDGDAADQFFAAADAGMNEFRADFPDFTDFGRFEPLALDAVERLIAAGRILDANKRLDRLREAFKNDPNVTEQIERLTEQANRRE